MPHNSQKLNVDFYQAYLQNQSRKKRQLSAHVKSGASKISLGNLNKVASRASAAQEDGGELPMPVRMRTELLTPGGDLIGGSNLPGDDVMTRDSSIS